MTEDKSHTSIDLGEDLLEDDESSLNIEAEKSKSFLSEGVLEAIHSARILMTEGLLEEAKKVLFQVLRTDMRNVSVRELLQEIHQMELRQIFSSSPPRQKELLDWQSINVEEVAFHLEEVLGVPDEEEVIREMLGDPKVIHDYCQRQKNQLGPLTHRERIDLAIGFLEMGLAPVALEYLSDIENGEEWETAKANLSAMAYLQMRKPYEATQTLESIVHDGDRPMEEKLESIYWMGRAYEQLGKPLEAAKIYQRLSMNDYRDSKKRVERISKK